MTNEVVTVDRSGLRAAGGWLMTASGLLILALAFHGPLHPDPEMQMMRIAEAPARWAAVHWTAAAALSSFIVAAILVLTARSRLTGSGRARSAWAVVVVGAVWTLITAVTEVTVIADLAVARNLSAFEAWWSLAEGFGSGFAFLALAIAVIAANEYRDSRRLLPQLTAGAAVAAALASFAGWALGVWLDIRPANFLWLAASGAMCAWLAAFGLALASPKSDNDLRV